MKEEIFQQAYFEERGMFGAISPDYELLNLIKKGYENLFGENTGAALRVLTNGIEKFLDSEDFEARAMFVN